MNRKLTVSLDGDVIDFTHTFSRKTQQPISKIIENYFQELINVKEIDLPADMAELYGIFEESKAHGKKEIRKMFHEKHNL
ncbi:hypothetical protein FACS1894190_12880 [Spirochaetia bacterium]|nr:hypothetical protein FACS1894190_12880 [Spirochaetia bacterium]